MRFTRLARVLLPCALAFSAEGYELFADERWRADASLNTRLGLRQGYGINFGRGALQDFGTFNLSTGERERTDLQLALRPSLTTEFTAPADTVLYGGVTLVAATATLDGELSGQFARAGDQAFDNDAAYVGVRRGH